MPELQVSADRGCKTCALTREALRYYVNTDMVGYGLISTEQLRVLTGTIMAFSSSD